MARLKASKWTALIGAILFLAIVWRWAMRLAEREEELYDDSKDVWRRNRPPA
ncbi:MAG: hypothetical protein KBI12_06185 [Methanothrix sp.]|jgi:hypothetical protein|nr:hypothetical protein [Methanothrix sp.]